MKPWFLLALLSTPAFAADGATVILLRGTAKTSAGKELQLKDEVPPGTTITTSPKSFVKLLFRDQTQMNIGPASTLKIEATRAGEASLVNLMAGQLRAKVTKDPLRDPSGQPKEKMVVKTRTAAMGIRGTDFNVSYNPNNGITALVTYEGNVAMARLRDGEHPLQALRQPGFVQSVSAGQFSGAQYDRPVASVPVRISPVQFEALKGNDAFAGLGEKPVQKAESFASPIPPGVDPKSFASATPAEGRVPANNSAPAEGYYNPASGAYAPRAGGYLDLNSGRYVPPPAGSSFDANTGVYVPPKAMGEVDTRTGMYVPPKGVELDPVKGFVPEAATTGARTPSSSAAVNAAAALNYVTKPENSGKAVSFEKIFVPGGAPALPPPPPPPPPVAADLPPAPKGPIDDPYCPTCIKDNVQTTPTETRVNFKITTTP